MTCHTRLAVRAIASAARAGPSTRSCGICASQSHSSPQPKVRQFTSSTHHQSLKSFFASRRSAPSDPYSDYFQAIKANHILSLKNSYDLLLAKQREAISHLNTPHDLEPDKRSLRAGEVMQAMTFLSGRSELSALALLKRIYADLPLWGIRGEAKHFRAVFRGLCATGRVEDALNWVNTYPENMDLDLWRILLRTAIRYDADLVREVEAGLRSRAKEEGTELNGSDFIAFLRDLRVNTPGDYAAKKRLVDILTETKEKGIWIGREGEAELAGVHLKLGDLDRAKNLVQGWDLGKGHSKDHPALWNTAIDYYIASDNAAATHETMEQMKELGLAPYEKGLTYLIIDSLKEDPSIENIVDVVDRFESKYGTKFSYGWSQIIDRNPQAYDEAKARGIQTDSRIAKSLIFPLCAQNPPDLRTALDVYADFTSNIITITTSSVRSRVLAIYATLFRAYCRMPAPDQNIPVRLLKDMRRFGLALPTPALTSLLISLIRHSPDHHSAFNTYAHLYALDPSLLDVKAYGAIIAAFVNHSTPSSPFAKPSYVMEMIKDMRKSGFVPSAQILTSLLKIYGAQAKQSRKSTTDPVYLQTKIDALHKSIGEIHNVLKLEPIISPDVPLYNALMDAYSRVQAYASAFEVWDILVERLASEPNKALYGPSVSIIIDTCGRAGQLNRARKVWSWIRRKDLVTGTKEWEGWIECLCRLGEIKEAADLVLVDGKIEPGVTTEMVRILLRFSWADKFMFKTLPGRIQEKYPKMWEEVKDIVATSSKREV